MPFKQLTTNTQRISVKPIPLAASAASGKHAWLPSPRITLTQQFEQSIITAQVGEPITYTLTINAEQLQASQLPIINIDSTDALNIYADQPLKNNQSSATGIDSTQTISYAVIPKKTGQLNFPSITLHWWNTTNNKEETITLESQTIIAAAANTSPLAPNIQTTLLENTQEKEISEIKSTASATEKSAATNTFWFWATVLLFFIAVITSILLVIQRRYYRRRISFLNDTNNNSSLPEEQAQINIEKVYQAIEDAIVKNDMNALAHLLRQWGSHISKQHITTDEAVLAHFNELAPTIRVIQQHLYSNTNNCSNIDISLVEQLKEIARKYAANVKREKNIVTKTELASLY